VDKSAAGRLRRLWRGVIRFRSRRLWATVGSAAIVVGALLAATSSPRAVAATLCFGQPATIVGTTNNETITGTSGDDVIVGLGGNDTISGRGGNDRLDGGAGNDGVFGTTGKDEMLGGDGNDIMTGGQADIGSDLMIGGAGDDTMLSGGGGPDRMMGGAGNDVIHGQDGSDDLRGGPGDDTLHGGIADDSVRGQSGRDVLVGGDGRDRLVGGRDNDVIDGSGGTDHVVRARRDVCLDAERRRRCRSASPQHATSPVRRRGHCRGHRATITGTRRNDLLIGTDRRDVVDARGGTDVVIGLVETHERRKTIELLEGIEVVPRRQTGGPLDEMDVDAVLARRPDVALVDELVYA
jgi:Ca2+-binding RTX toxin-like protein